MPDSAVKKMISYCGLVCSTCPVYIATLNDDNNKRKEVAETLKREYGRIVEPEDINCSGCTLVTGKHLEGCESCEIRKCGLAKGVKNCGYCKDYVCEKLADFPEFTVSCQKRLDKVKQGVK